MPLATASAGTSAVLYRFDWAAKMWLEIEGLRPAEMLRDLLSELQVGMEKVHFEKMVPAEMGWKWVKVESTTRIDATSKYRIVEKGRRTGNLRPACQFFPPFCRSHGHSYRMARG